MKKTISARSVNTIFKIAEMAIYTIRLFFFVMLAIGISMIVMRNWKAASFCLLVSSVIGGIVEPGLAGGYTAAVKNVNEQTLEKQQNKREGRV